METLRNGLKKLFHKKRPFEPINKYALTPKEKEYVAAFLGVLLTVILVIILSPFL